MPTDDPIMPRAASVSGAVAAGAEPQQADDDYDLTLAQAEQLLAELLGLEINQTWLAPFTRRFGEIVKDARESGSMREIYFQIVPPGAEPEDDEIDDD